RGRGRLTAVTRTLVTETLVVRSLKPIVAVFVGDDLVGVLLFSRGWVGLLLGVLLLRVRARRFRFFLCSHVGHVQLLRSARRCTFRSSSSATGRVEEFLDALAFIGLGNKEVALRIDREVVRAVELSSPVSGAAEGAHHLERLPIEDIDLLIRAVG